MLGTEEKKTIMSGEDAIKLLKAGNERFVAEKTEVFTATDEHLERIGATIQKPHSVILTCSDARLALELMFDQHFGELFVVRSAGNVLGQSIIGSIEFAVQNLGAVNVLILGHSNCGAVISALNTPALGNTGSPYIDFILHDIQQRLITPQPVKFSKDYMVECTHNVKGIRDMLVRKSEIIRKAYEQNKITVSYALYHMDTGKVEFFED